MSKLYGTLKGDANAALPRTAHRVIEARLKTDADISVNAYIFITRDGGYRLQVDVIGDTFLHSLYDGALTQEAVRGLPPITREGYQQIIDAQKREIARLEAALKEKTEGLAWLSGQYNHVVENQNAQDARMRDPQWRSEFWRALRDEEDQEERAYHATPEVKEYTNA